MIPGPQLSKKQEPRLVPKSESSGYFLLCSTPTLKGVFTSKERKMKLKGLTVVSSMSWLIFLGAEGMENQNNADSDGGMT